MTQEEERCMATLREVVSELLEELDNMGVDEETVAIAAKSHAMRESMHSDKLLRVLQRARLALADSAQGKKTTNNETQADIFAEMRGNEFDDPHAPKPGPNWKDICAKCNDGDIEPHFCRYYGEPNGCNSPIYGEHPAAEKPAGNAAAMHEACEKVCDLLMLRGDGKTQCVLTWDEFNESQKMLRAALATTPRNCDVGTLTEQQQRFHDFCEKMQHTDKACCGGCPIVHLRMQSVIDNSCELAWAQMPYEEEKA